MLGAIFISYRRSDSEGEAGRLSDVLTHHFNDQAVFMDVDAIQPGRDFRKAIEESIQACAVLLTVIGPDWLDARNPTGERRLDEPNDYVRLEIAAALRRDIPVIPVLVRGAKVPQPEHLPEDLADLAYRNGVSLTHSRWKSDLQILIQALEPYMGHHTKPAPLPNHKPAPAVAHPATLDAASVQHITRLLAHSIGPIAEFVVKRASAKHHTYADLANAVAEEIDDPAGRRLFLSQATAQSRPKT